MTSIERFKEVLDQNHSWPSEYPFKFIIKPPQVSKIKEILDGVDILLRESKTGKYVSVSFELKVASSDEVVYIYEKISTIEGVISL